MMKKSLYIVLGVMLFSACETADEFITGDSHETQSTETQSGVIQPQKTPKLHYIYGGVKGENAVEDPMVRIANLRINGRSGMSYSWDNGSSLAAWGLGNDTAGALACIFYRGSDGEWYGGKFDWISTSRRTRDFKNLNEGYNGWNPEKFYAAKHHGFLILSSNGKKRSNFIVE